MPLYAILKRFLGEWLDFFVFGIIVFLYYLGVLQKSVLMSSLEILGFFYMYKIYYILLVRQYDRGKKYMFTWDFDRIFSMEFLKRNNIYIYYLLLLLPWNLFWYIVVSFAVLKKLVKIWFNGNKDIFFKRYFYIDIRIGFDKYIVWYYTYINKYVVMFVHEPLLRMIVIPTLIRNAVIYSSFFSLLKARMFMFIFISLLVFSGLIEYFVQPIYIWIIIIYIYYLIIWPMITKWFKIEYININGELLMKYTTPQNIYFAFLVVWKSSISLNCLFEFVAFLNTRNIDKYFLNFRFLLFPLWYRLLFLLDVLNEKGLNDGINNDAMIAGVMFWRYEKTYSSFIQYDSLVRSDYFYAFIALYMLNIQCYGGHIREEEIEKMRKYLEEYLRIFIFSLAECINGLTEDVDYARHFFLRKEQDDFIKGEYDYVIMEFYKNRQITEFFRIPVKFQGIEGYIEKAKITSFFFAFEHKSWSYVDKYWYWFYEFLDNVFYCAKQNGCHEFHTDEWAIYYQVSEIRFTNDKTLESEEIDMVNDLCKEFEDLKKDDPLKQIVKVEDLFKLIK